MSVAAVRRVVCRLGPDHPPTDADLVTAIAPGGGDREAAFGELVGRYGPMVLGVCRRVLSDAHAAEDAFQAVFIVLARKAGAIRPPGTVAGWLHGVAVRTARKAKTAAARRRRREMAAIVSANTEQTSRESESPVTQIDRSELRAIIDAELAALPETHRAALVLCDLHGKSRAEAAAELNRAEGTVASWLARGRKALAARLVRRGAALPAAGLVTVAVPEVVSAELAASVTSTFTGRGAAAGVLALAEGVMKSLSSSVATKLTATVLALGALLVAVTTAPAWFAGERRPMAELPGAGATPDPKPEPVPRGAPAEPVPPVWKEANVLDLTGWVGGSVAYSADGKTLFVGGTGGHVRAYDAATLKRLWESKDGDSFAAVSPAGDGKTLAATFKDGVRFLDAATGKIGDVLEEKGSEPITVACMPDTPLPQGDALALTSRKVIFGSPRGSIVKMWLEWPKVSTIQSSTVAAGKEPADKFAVPLAVAPDGSRVVVTGPFDRDTKRNVLWAWAAGSGTGNKILDGHKATAISAAWATNGEVLVTGDADGIVITWDPKTFKEKSRLVLGGRVVAVAVSPDGTATAAAVTQPDQENKDAYTEEVFVWPTANPPAKPKPISSHTAGGPFLGLAGLAFAPDGKTLVSAFSNFDHLTKLGDLIGRVRVFAVAPAPGKPAPNARFIIDTSFSPDGTKYAVVAAGKAEVFDNTTGKQLDSVATEVFDSTTGKRLYSVAAYAVRFGADSKKLFGMSDKVLECDADTGKIVKSYPLPKTKWGWHWVAFSPDGKRYVAHFGFHARVYDTATGLEPVQLDEQSEMAGWLQGGGGSSIAFSPDGKRIVAVGVLITPNGQLGAAVWDTESGKRLHTFTGNPDGPLVAAYSADGKQLAIAFEKRIEVWAEGKMKPTTLGDRGPITALAFHPDGKRLAAGIRLPIFRGADVETPRIVGHKTEVRLIDVATDKVVKVFDGFEGVNHTAPTKRPVTALAFNRDGKKLIAGTGIERREWLMVAGPDTVEALPKAAEVKVFDLDGLSEKPAPDMGQQWTDAAVLEDHGARVNGVTIAPDGKSFSAATEGNVTCWDSVTRNKLWSHKLDAPAFALAFHPDGKYLFVAGKTDLIRLDAATGEKKPLYGNASGVGFDNYIQKTKDSHARQLAFSQDGKRLALSDGYMTWTVEPESPENHRTIQRRPDETPKNPKPTLAGVAWAPDGKRLAAIQPKRTPDTHWPVQIWNTDGSGPVRSLLGHDHPVTAVAWSKDGAVIASGDDKGLVILWDAATNKELWRSRQFRGRDDTDGRVNALAISPADNTVAAAVSLGSGKGPERVALLAAKDGAVHDQLMRGALPVTSVAWSKDGMRLVTGSGALPEQGARPTEPAVGEVVVWERKK